jgi:phosphopantetheinyl transferase (holo-ACP synthase)
MYAQIWAAKEAVYKCLSPDEAWDLRKVEIRFTVQGKPFAVLPDGSRPSGLDLSLARAGRLAVAVAVRR